MATVGYGERVTRTISVTPGTQYTVTIGAGGKGSEGITAHNSNYIYGTAGEASSALGVTARGGVYNGSSNTNYSNGGSPAGKSSGSQGSTGGDGVDGFCILSYKVDKDKYSKKMSSIPKNVFEMQKKDGSKYLLYKDVVMLKRVRLIYKTVGTYSLRIPAGITKIYVTGCGGGAGGGSFHFYDSDGTSNQIGVAGNSGAYVADAEVEVTPNSTIQIVVGAGGKNTFYSNDSDRAGRFRVSDGTQGFVIIEYGGTTPYIPTVNRNSELTCKCYLDDNVIMGSTVTVNGETHHTNQLGVFSLLNKTWGRKEKLTFEYIDSSGVLHTAAYNVQYGAIEVLEVKFISVITGEKHFSSSETTASFTVPIGITKIKVDADCLIADAPFEEDVSYAISVINNSTKKVWGSGYSYSNLEDEGNTDHQDMHSIVAVTAGKTYTLTLNISDSVDGVTFSYGTDINELTATVSDL